MLKLLSTITKTLVVFGMLFLTQLLSAQTPVQKYGQLQIKNGKVADKNGNPVVLRGMSMFWSGYPEGSPFYNANTVQWLRDDWCVDVVRAAMSVETGNTNYVGNAGTEMQKIKTVIDACIANGLYVIVDFHTHNAPNYLNQAKTFFTEIATQYGNLPNIIYEPYNEPIKQDWATEIKPYHNAIIPVIRAIDNNNIIVCGTKNFSQDVDEAANDQVTGTNIAYTLHYYADTHRESLRQKAVNAMNRGVALFVTEYGTCDASGDRNYNEAESNIWFDFLEEHMLSSCNWSVGNKGETSSVLSPGLQKQNNWSTNELTTSGKLVRNYLNGKCNLVVTTGSVTVSFAGDQTQYEVGESVTINAATTVANGTVAKVEFYSGTNLIGSDNAAPYSITVDDLLPGGHNIIAKSFDGSGNLISNSPLRVIAVVGASKVSTTGITDQFESTEQFFELTGGATGTDCDNPDEAAAMGIFWYEDKNPATDFSAEASRLGDGTLTYLLSQAAGQYNVVGFNFGEYCLNGERKKYTLDLSGDANLQLTVSAPASNTEKLDLKFQMKDADGTVLAINKTVLLTNGTVDEEFWYKHELGFSKNHAAPDFVSLQPASTTNFIFDFKDALTIQNPNDPTFPDDINTNNNDFDFSKVMEIVIIPVNSVDDGAPTYAPLAFDNQTVIFSGLSMGDPALGQAFCTTPNAAVANNASYCQNSSDVEAFSATGITDLTQKWYTSASGGTAIEVAPIPSTASAETITYYVSEAISSTSTCEGPRVPVTVEIVEAPTAAIMVEEDEPLVGPSVSLTGSGSSVGTWEIVSGASDNAVITPADDVEDVIVKEMDEIGLYTISYTVTGDALCEDAVAEVELDITTLVSTNLNLNDGSITFYPNPVGNELNIVIEDVSTVESVSIVDVVGRTIYTNNAPAKNTNINTSNWSNGLYIIKVQTLSGTVVSSVKK